MDQRKFALLEALKTGALHAGEIRLYRRGKHPGLFAQRDRQLADEAVHDGLIEIVRVETVGKTAIEWVRVTKKGLDLLLQSESPARALEELRAVLALNEDGIPIWLADMQNRLDTLTSRFVAEVVQMKLQLDQLSNRTIDAIEQIEQAQAFAPAPPPSIAWAQDALDVLEERRQVGHGERCSLRDLFAALQETHVDLTIRDFHQGLKRLQESGLLTLLPDVPSGEAPGPEYALLDSAAVYYYVERAKN